MPPLLAIPVCPPPIPCGLERLFIQQGWIWNDDVLTDVLTWLHQQGIEDDVDLVGTCRAEDIPGAERFPCDVLHFISKAAKAGSNVTVSLLLGGRISCVTGGGESRGGTQRRGRGPEGSLAVDMRTGTCMCVPSFAEAGDRRCIAICIGPLGRTGC